MTVTRTAHTYVTCKRFPHTDSFCPCVTAEVVRPRVVEGVSPGRCVSLTIRPHKETSFCLVSCIYKKLFLVHGLSPSLTHLLLELEHNTHVCLLNSCGASLCAHPRRDLHVLTVAAGFLQWVCCLSSHQENHSVLWDSWQLMSLQGCCVILWDRRWSRTESFFNNFSLLSSDSTGGQINIAVKHHRV